MTIERISHRAYILWEQAGKPDGAHEEHWREASLQIADEDGQIMADEKVVAKAVAGTRRLRTHSQKMTVAARQMAEKKAVGHLS